MFEPGQHFGRYRIERLLEQGGMSEIYVATDTRLNRRVAIKIIRTGNLSPHVENTFDEATRLFQREARAVMELDHPHILPLYDSDTTTVGGKPCMYIIMPYRREGSLADWKQKQGDVLPLYEVLHIVQQAADALQHAHDHHIIHRDVKPSNFLIILNRHQPDLPHIQLADFGIAKFIHALSPPSLLIRGTPVYMAPEHWRGRAVPATDQYALAVMAYELLTGYPPFEGDTPEQHMYHHLHQQPQPPGELNSSIPLAVDEVLLRALEKEPQNRYPSIATFAHAFQQAVSSVEAEAITVIISRTEARKGTTRLVTLPDGHQEQVVLPPGVYNGQLIPLDIPEGTYAGADPIFIKVEVKTTDEILTLSTEGQGSVAKTLPASAVSSHRRVFSFLTFIALITALLLILSGVGVVVFSAIKQHEADLQMMNALATRQKEARQAALGASATSRANLTATGQYNLTATSIVATATTSGLTAIASASTATAAAGATALAISHLTATAVAMDAYYKMLKIGPRKMNDPLQDNSMGFNWDIVNPASGAGCLFDQSGYHVLVSQQGFWPCFASNTNFADFAFQVTATINRGDSAGIVFRADTTNKSFYYFHVNSDGTYDLETVTNLTHGPILSHGMVPGGLKQTNYIAVVAIGSSIKLFVNMQVVDTVTDTTFTQGAVGVVAEDVTGSTDVTFTDAMAWVKS